MMVNKCETSCNKIKTKCAKYLDVIPPCNKRCPVGENIQLWLDLFQAGRYKDAWNIITAVNPMPSIHGRVCYHTCETDCNRKYFDSAVNIHSIERFLGDMAIEEGWSLQVDINGNKNDKKILVVGAGPAGLSCTYHLRRLGYGVSLYDELDHLGGVMYFGIPDYRLPHKILESEVRRIISTGVDLRLKYKVEDIIKEKNDGGFDVVFLAIGTQIGRRLKVKFAENGNCPIYDSMTFLKSLKKEDFKCDTKNLIVFGGSNTAMDVARSAVRVGVKNVIVAYHRNKARMAAFKEEIKEAEEEGIVIKDLRTLNYVDKNKITFNISELDASGTPFATGVTESVDADMLVFAIGQSPDLSFFKKIPEMKLDQNGYIQVDDQFSTSCDGIFAGGDIVPSDQSVTIATGHGKKAAFCIDAYLNGQKYKKESREEVANYESMKLWFVEKKERIEQSILVADKRKLSFDEVFYGLDKNQAIFEAKKCFSCGNCFECDGCYAVCPTDAISKLGYKKRYKLDPAKCIGCEACVKQCPCAAIRMEGTETKL